ncbi:hypothetical protein BDV24DRAFT_169854 [Aspergillus arachidicola]|uniref:Uncharacterized protein n=1 Tax=Aspergillus arachidicola TaxID=656916 RepID=A0A5N6XNE7_9EURO|nr:hypothetical protein BDV24DRAFT_169854 [Aspergillus arachidicola]
MSGAGWLNKNIDTKSQEVQKHFVGFAKISLQQLSHEFDAEENVKWYSKRFTLDECSRLDPEHFVIAVITEDQLNRAILDTGIAPEGLSFSQNPPHLMLEKNVVLPCLRGRDLLEAARRFLPPGEKWWTTRLYLNSLPLYLQIHLTAQYAIETNITDAQAFRDLLCNYAPRTSEGWRHKFKSDTDYHYVKKVDSNIPLRGALADIAPYQGLWETFTYRKLEYMFNPRCNEVMVSYLTNIYRLWSGLFPGDMAFLVDPKSVGFLEGLMPKYSLDDRNKIVDAINDSCQASLFPRLTNSKDRDRVLQSLLIVPGRILTLSTFFQDAILLSGPARAVRDICSTRNKVSIQDVLLRSWAGWNGSCCVQLSETRFEEVKLPSGITIEKLEEFASLISLLQLWLVAFRHFIEPRKGRTNGKDSVQPLLKVRGRPLLSSAARKFGFDISRDHQNTYRNPNLPAFQYICETLSRDVVGPEANRKVNYIAGKFRELFDVEQKQSAAPLMPDHAVNWDKERPDRRAGRPLQREYLYDRKFLFIKYIYCPDQEAKHYPTSFAILRDIFLSFFGRHPMIELLRGEQPATTVALSMETPVQHIANQQPSEEEETLVDNCQQYPIDEDPQNIDDASSVLSPVELHPHPPEPHHAQMDGVEKSVPLAAGFEDEICKGPVCTRIPISVHRKAEEILTTWYKSDHSSVVVFYLFNSREYYKFFSDDELNIRLSLTDLALDHYFLLLDGDAFRSEAPDTALKDVLQSKLLLVGTKSRPGELENRKGGITREDLEEYISRYDVFTGKRRNTSDEHDQRPVTRRRA